jgi:acyl-CoA thioesterase I
MRKISQNMHLGWVVLLFLLLLAGCGDDKKTEEKAADGGTTPGGIIVAVGDSLTAGLGLDEDRAYPAQLQRKLQAAGRNFKVINAGVSGETSSDSLSRLDWILTLQPDIVILETGANDGLRGIDPALPRANIAEILRILKEKKIVTIFTGMKMVWNLGPVYTGQFNRIYPELAADSGVIFMPFFLEDVATVAAFNQDDGLHPNEKGYAVIVDNIYPYVLKAIHELEKGKQ